VENSGLLAGMISKQNVLLYFDSLTSPNPAAVFGVWI